MPQTAAEEFRDRMLAHQVGLQRLSTKDIRASLALLERTRKEVNRLLRARLAVSPGLDPGPFTTLRLKAIMAEIDEALRIGYRQIRDQLKLSLGELADFEARFGAEALRAAIPREVGLSIGLPPPEVLRTIATAEPFQGKLLREHFAKLPRTMRGRIKRVVREGLVSGDSVETMVRRLPWSKARNELKAVVDSGTKHVSQQARREFLQANAGDAGPVKGYQWLSTLDLRTTKHICVPRDGKAYSLTFQPIGHGYPWGAGPGAIHWRCRSGMTSILKSWEELGIDAKEITGATRASMDGAVPRKITAAQFFASRKWSDADLREMFGKRRGALVRAGDLSLEGALVQVGIPRGLVRGATI